MTAPIHTAIAAPLSTPERPPALRFGDLPPAARPHIRLRTLGATALTVPELLALLLGDAGDRSPVVGVGHQLIEASGGSLRRLATESPAVLERVHGIGPGRVNRIMAMGELARRWATETPIARPPIRCPSDIAAFYAPRLQDLTVEQFHVGALDVQFGLERDICVSRGLLNSTLVHAREVFLGAVEARAHAVVLVHNHPGGDPTPSPEDLLLTEQLASAGRVLDILIYDHVIIGRECYCSFLEQHWL